MRFGNVALHFCSTYGIDNLRAESGERIDPRFLFLGSLFGYRQQEIVIQRKPITGTINLPFRFTSFHQNYRTNLSQTGTN